MTQNQNDIYADYYDQIYDYVKGSPVTEQECVLIMSLLNKPTGKILDVGAGTGRHALALADRNYDITAIDSSEQMLHKIKIRNPNVITINKDVFEFLHTNAEKYDMIILMWNSINEIALTNTKLADLFTGLKRVLTPQGIILINTNTIEEGVPYSAEFSHEIMAETGDRIRIEWSNDKNDTKTNTTISREQLFINEIPQRTAFITQRWWALADIKKYAQTAGFTSNEHSLPCNNELYIALRNS